MEGFIWVYTVRHGIAKNSLRSDRNPSRRRILSDMLDVKTGTCEICEIKHSREAADDQFRHLVDASKCAQVERLFGRISARKVFYRGSGFVHPSGVEYLNVEDYLQRIVK